MTITNSNPVSVDLSVAVSGADAGDFKIANANSCSGSLQSSQSCIVNVTFEPTATGNRKADLVVNEAGKNRDVAMIGVGTAGGATPTAAATQATATATPTATSTMTQSATPTSTETASPTSTMTSTPTATMTIGFPTILATGPPLWRLPVFPPALPPLRRRPLQP